MERKFAIEKTQTVTADKPLMGHCAALTELNKLLDLRYGDRVYVVESDAFNQLRIEFDIEVDMDVELNYLQKIIEEAEFHAQQVKEENDNTYEKMRIQNDALFKMISDYRMHWSVPDVELDDIAIKGTCMVHFSNYEMDDFKSDALTDPTWRELAVFFNECLIKSDDKGHYFMEGVYKRNENKEVYRFIKGS